MENNYSDIKEIFYEREDLPFGDLVEIKYESYTEGEFFVLGYITDVTDEKIHITTLALTEEYKSVEVVLEAKNIEIKSIVFIVVDFRAQGTMNQLEYAGYIRRTKRIYPKANVQQKVYYVN